MERSAKSRQTVMITQNLNADPMWTQNLPLSFVPDEVIVRSVRYLADPADPSTMAFVTADSFKTQTASCYVNSLLIG